MRIETTSHCKLVCFKTVVVQSKIQVLLRDTRGTLQGLVSAQYGCSCRTQHRSLWARTRRPPRFGQAASLSPKCLMLQTASMSGSQQVVKNVTRPKAVLPRVCGTRFYNDSGFGSDRDKNDRFWHDSLRQVHLRVEVAAKVWKELKLLIFCIAAKVRSTDLGLFRVARLPA